MTTYSTGTISLTNGSASVTGAGTGFAANVSAGDWLTNRLDAISYQVASVADDTHLTLTAPYGGTTGTGLAYEINRDQTPLGIPLTQRGDLAPFGVLGQAFLKIDALITAMSGGAYYKQPASALLTSVSALALVAGDLIFGSDDDEAGRLVIGAAGQHLTVSGGVPAWGNAPVGVPQGRLTLSSGVPVPAADVTGATSLYYTPYAGDQIPLYDGTRFVMTDFAELTQALSDTTYSPAASLANKLYDLFVWSDGGTLRLSRGPAWASDTTRGTGAGTTELERIKGFLVNKIAITNGPAAARGTYVGTIRTNASNQVPMLMRPNAASGGSANQLFCWNMYQRQAVHAVAREADNSWTYTTATIRAMNNSANNSIAFICGIAEGFLEAALCASSASSNGQARYAVIGYDATNAMAAGCLSEHCTEAANIVTGHRALLDRSCELGLHQVTALEYSTASGTTTWYGDAAAPTLVQSGLTLKLAM